MELKCGFVHVTVALTEAVRGQTNITRGCELPSMDTGDQLWVLWKISMHS